MTLSYEDWTEKQLIPRRDRLRKLLAEQRLTPRQIGELQLISYYLDHTDAYRKALSSGATVLLPGQNGEVFTPGDKTALLQFFQQKFPAGQQTNDDEDDGF